jgi:glycosyltransferase involved in cell wall biosynthesis
MSINTAYQPRRETVAVLIPCRDEASAIGGVIDSFRSQVPEAEIYVFDNASEDQTAEIAEAAGATVIYVPVPGKGNVVREMFRKVQSDIYVIVDGDGTYFAEDLPKMIDLVRARKADLVIGDRLTSEVYDRQNTRNFHSAGNRLVRWLINSIYDSDAKDILSGFRVFNDCFVRNCPILSRGFEVETEMSINAIDRKFSVIDVPISYQERAPGSQSKLKTFSDGIKILKTIAFLFKNYLPLRFFTTISLVVAVVGFGLGWFPILEYMELGYVHKVPLAILAASLEIVAALLFCCGLILDTSVRHYRQQAEMQIISCKDRALSQLEH